MRRGSVTVFLALVLVLVLSFVCSLLEGARLLCIRAEAQMITDICMQSMFGNYHAGIWEDYHLLFLDGSWQTGDFSPEKFAGRAMDELEKNLLPGKDYTGTKFWDLTKFSAVDFDVTAYELATDYDGSVFEHQVSQQMKLEAASDALEKLSGLQEQKDAAEMEQKKKENKWEQACDAIEEAEEWKEEAELEGFEVSESVVANGETELENPMEYVQEIKGFSVLSLVLEDPSGLSGKALEHPNFLVDRDRNQGNWEENSDANMTDRLWLQYYIQDYFSSYTGKSEKGPAETKLDYEIEYIIGGKESDGDNLEIVVNELLGIREAMNLATIMQDSTKTALALEIAMAAVGFTMMPLLVKAVQVGILLAWAYIESILDVRSLLEGKKVPFLKRKDQWISDISGCRKCVESNAKTPEDEEGLNYGQYLQMLIMSLSQKILNYRCMDLIEQNEEVRMDSMLQSAEGVVQYQAEPLFWSLNMVSNQSFSAFSLVNSSTMTYGAFE